MRVKVYSKSSDMLDSLHVMITGSIRHKDSVEFVDVSPKHLAWLENLMLTLRRHTDTQIMLDISK